MSYSIDNCVKYLLCTNFVWARHIPINVAMW